MKEFSTYDEMMGTYYENSCNMILPLNSWEFYGEYSNNLFLCKDDLITLQKISANWDFNENYKKQLVENRKVIVVTDLNLKIVFASKNIEEMNGFMPAEVIGRSPKMFQGKETSQKTTSQIRTAIDSQVPFEYSLINYKKDKSKYLCNIQGFPVMNKKGKLVNYIAFEKAA